MKKTIKKSLSIILTILMIFTAVPFVGITAFAQAEETATAVENYRFIQEDGIFKYFLSEDRNTYFATIVDIDPDFEGVLTIPEKIGGGYEVETIYPKALENNKKITGVKFESFTVAPTVPKKEYDLSHIETLVLPDLRSMLGITTEEEALEIVNALSDEELVALLGESSLESKDRAVELYLDSFYKEFAKNVSFDELFEGLNGTLSTLNQTCCLMGFDFKNVEIGKNDLFYKKTGDCLYTNDSSPLMKYFSDFKYALAGAVPTIREATVTESVSEIIPLAFAAQGNLEKVVLPDSIKTIDDFAFFCCVNLKDFEIPKNTEKIGNYAFMLCLMLDEITFPASLKRLGDTAFMYNAGVKELEIPATIEKIGPNNFENFMALEKVTIRCNLNSIDSNTFKESLCLKEIYYYGGYVSDLHEYFEDCGYDITVMSYEELIKWCIKLYLYAYTDLALTQEEYVELLEMTDKIEDAFSMGTGDHFTFYAHDMEEFKTAFANRDVTVKAIDGHSITVGDGIESGCNTAGTTAVLTCDVCGKFNADNLGTVPHNDGDNDGICDDCNDITYKIEVTTPENLAAVPNGNTPITITDKKYTFAQFEADETRTYRVTVDSSSVDFGYDLLILDEDLNEVAKSRGWGGTNRVVVDLQEGKTYYLAFNIISGIDTIDLSVGVSKWHIVEEWLPSTTRINSDCNLQEKYYEAVCQCCNITVEKTVYLGNGYAHNYVIKETLPNCEENGRYDTECTICRSVSSTKKGFAYHVDEDKDNICDKCSDIAVNKIDLEQEISLVMDKKDFILYSFTPTHTGPYKIEGYDVKSKADLYLTIFDSEGRKYGTWWWSTDLSDTITEETLIAGKTYYLHFTSSTVANQENDLKFKITCNHICDWFPSETFCTDGKLEGKCLLCNEVFKTKTAESFAHSYKSETKAPTCTKEGYTLNTCELCGDSYKDNVTNTVPHNYKAVKTSATCTENGYTTYTCTECNYSYKGDTVNAQGHKFDKGECTVCREKDPSYEEPKEETNPIKAFFDKISEFFQSIIDFFKNLFK